MRKNIVVTGFTIAALVAAGGAPVYAQNTTGEKIEKKTEETKDKAKQGLRLRERVGHDISGAPSVQSE